MPRKDLIATILKWFNRSSNSRNHHNHTPKENNMDSSVEKALSNLKVTQISEAHLGDSYGHNNIDVPIVDYIDQINEFRRALQESYKER